MKRHIIIGISVIIVTFLTAGLLYSYASNTSAGTIGDPLVTKSYVDQFIQGIEIRLEAVENKMDDLNLVITNLESNSGNQAGDLQGVDLEALNQYIDESVAQKLAEITVDGDVVASTGFIVIKLEAGQSLYGGESAEIILRAGTAKVIANEAGDGLADITIGEDIKDMGQVEKNHLLIVPRADNRGLLFETESYIMIKGDYTIQ